MNPSPVCNIRILSNGAEFSKDNRHCFGTNPVLLKKQKKNNLTDQNEDLTVDAHRIVTKKLTIHPTIVEKQRGEEGKK